MSKQTATDYLIQEIKNDSLVQAKSTKEWNEVFQKAKKMEREQMRKTYSHGWTTRERFDDLVSDLIYPLGLDYEEKQEYAFQQYYNETYGI